MYILYMTVIKLVYYWLEQKMSKIYFVNIYFEKIL